MKNFDVTKVTDVGTMFELVAATIEIITNENTKTSIEEYYPNLNITIAQ